MSKRIALSSFARHIPEIPQNVLKTALETSMKPQEDYIPNGDDPYIYLSAALFLIGRFAITNVHALEPYIELLSQKTHSVSILPVVNTDSAQMEWAEKITPLIYQNAKALEMEKNRFLALVYKKMEWNATFWTGKYLDLIGRPCENASRVTKFAVVQTFDILRRRFENAMSDIMEEHRCRLSQKITTV